MLARFCRVDKAGQSREGLAIQGKSCRADKLGQGPAGQTRQGKVGEGCQGLARSCSVDRAGQSRRGWQGRARPVREILLALCPHRSQRYKVSYHHVLFRNLTKP
jgi:hypothetical protein